MNDPSPEKNARTRLLISGLEATGAAALLLSNDGQIEFITAAAKRLLGLGGEDLCGRDWEDFWHILAPEQPQLTDQPQRVLLVRGAQAAPARAWRRELGAGGQSLVTLEDIDAVEASEHEAQRVFREAQEQADDLFALYQITQFLNTATRLDQLCNTFLRELERITAAEIACLYLAADNGLQPKVWHGLFTTPPAQPDSESAQRWLSQRTNSLNALSLPLLAGAKLVGLALLAYQGAPARELRFLHTIAKEMGAALLAMSNRQALLAQEQKLEAVVSGTTDAIIQVDSARRVRNFNPAATRLTGLAPEQALGADCANALGCKQNSGCGGSCLFRQVLASGEPIPDAELKVQGRTLAAAVTLLDLGPDTAPGAVAIMRDISRQKQLEQMKSDFFSEVSHQLRTPLALLRGFSDTLLHLELSPAETAACIQGIADATTRMQNLVEQVIDLTRFEENSAQLRRAQLDLRGLGQAALNALPLNSAPNRVKVEIPSDLPQIFGDQQKLEQALINLIDNALKYSPAECAVFVRARSENRRVLVEIADSGIGVPPEEQDAIFDKFYRAANAVASQLPGAGLGLYISRAIIEAHGGRIALNSKPGAGACITFWLPISESED